MCNLGTGLRSLLKVCACPRCDNHYTDDPMPTFDYPTIAQLVDHSLLGPSLNEKALVEGCHLARAYGVASVCILPYAVAQAAKILRGSVTRTSTTVGFPHGGQVSKMKVAEAQCALADGATELDMVVNISKVKSGDFDFVRDDIAGVLEACRGHNAKLKVIFENAYLDDAEKIRLCELCGALGVDWVKTSTGYAPSGATDEDLILMRIHSPAHVQVKAAGGIADLDRVLAVQKLGVTRIGASKTAAILDECRTRLGLDPITVAGKDAPGGYFNAEVRPPSTC